MKHQDYYHSLKTLKAAAWALEQVPPSRCIFMRPLFALWSYRRWRWWKSKIVTNQRTGVRMAVLQCGWLFLSLRLPSAAKN